jgi:hypothetical protein
VTADARLAPTAEAWRDFGLASLTTRYRVLLGRASRRELTAGEKAEARSIAAALDQLQVLRPEGAPASERDNLTSGEAHIAHGTRERQ